MARLEGLVWVVCCVAGRLRRRASGGAACVHLTSEVGRDLCRASHPFCLAAAGNIPANVPPGGNGAQIVALCRAAG
jgi:hypothetical protein